MRASLKDLQACKNLLIRESQMISNSVCMLRGRILIKL